MTVSRVLPRVWLAGLTAGFCFGCSSSADTNWCESSVDGSEVVFSQGPGAWDREQRSPELQELWRAGGLREGEELAFPVGAVASPTGQLAIADFRLAEVIVLDPDGSWLGAWGARGEGPGELTSPVAATWDRRDGTLAVFDFGRAKVVFLRDGDPVREDVRVAPGLLAPVLASGEMLWAGVQPSGGVLVQPVPRMDPADPERRRGAVLYIAPGSQEADTLASNWNPTVGGSAPSASLAAPGWPRLVAAVGTDGAIALGGLDSRYRVLILDEHGLARRVICRDSPAVALDDRELRAPPEGSKATEHEAALRAAPRPDSLAPYGRVFLGARGRLWVQRERPAPLRYLAHLLGVPGSAYDVFDQDGRYLGEVQAPEQSRLQAAVGDTVWAYEIGDLDETWVVVYRLHFNPKQAS